MKDFQFCTLRHPFCFSKPLTCDVQVASQDISQSHHRRKCREWRAGYHIPFCHRGKLNVLSNVAQKPDELILLSVEIMALKELLMDSIPLPCQSAVRRLRIVRNHASEIRSMRVNTVGSVKATRIWHDKTLFMMLLSASTPSDQIANYETGQHYTKTRLDWIVKNT